jgi:hypothetical protein
MILLKAKKYKGLRRIDELPMTTVEASHRELRRWDYDSKTG